MKRRRSPLQTLLVTGAVTLGMIVGVRMVANARADSEAERRDRNLPNIELVGAAPEELLAAGYRLDGAAPSSWSDISLRYFVDQSGFVNCLSCLIDASEVDRLFQFPPGTRAPADGRPPDDWPWGSASNPWRVPAWWRSDGSRVRLYEEYPPGGLARGIFAAYDPETRRLNAWMWARSDWQPKREPEDLALVADAVAHSLADLAVRSKWPHDEQGWMVRSGLNTIDMTPMAGVLPPGAERVDTALLPRRGNHRYLIRVVGVSPEDARRVAGGVPLRELPSGSPPPTWDFAHPASGLPEWFTCGPGPRWQHQLRVLGTGAIEAARWAAYDPVQRTLLVWDWTADPPRLQP